MTCCDYGKCTQGKDCPVRQKEIVNKAYTDCGNVYDPNPYEEVFCTFKELVAVIILAASMWLVYFFIWVKL
jgi:hypothetical protein